MDDISTAVAHFLENPEAMGQLEAMAKQLGLAPEAQKPREQPDLLSGGLSPQLLGTLAGALQSTEEAAASAKLFETLRPLFGDGEKLDRAARAVQLTYAARAVTGALGSQQE